MAEQRNKISAQLPIRLYTDTEPEQQPERTYPFALNAVHDSSDGSMGSIVNEQGNIPCVDLPGAIKGIISVDEDFQIVFTDDNSISIFNSSSCTIETIVSEFTVYAKIKQKTSLFG